MHNEKDGSIHGYMCKIDWDHELGNAMDGNRVYATLEDLIREHDCWESCGIVRVKVTLSEVLVETDLTFGEDDENSNTKK